MSNNLLISLNVIKKCRLVFQYSLYSSLVLIQLLKSKRLERLKELIFKMELSSTYQWDKDKKKLQLKLYTLLQRLVTGLCSKMSISCRLGLNHSKETWKSATKKVFTITSESSFLLNPQDFLTRKLFLSPFCRTLLRLQMKHHKILKLTSEELSTNLINLISRKLQRINHMNSRLFCSVFVCSTP